MEKKEDSISRFEHLADLVTTSHHEISSFYGNLEKLEGIYSYIYNSINDLSLSLIEKAFNFYVKNHFEALLFVRDRVHELSIKTSTCSTLKMLIISKTEEKLAEMNHDKHSCEVHLDQLFPDERGLLIGLNCRDWLRGIKNMLSSMFFGVDFKSNAKFLRWKLHSSTHFKENVEFAIYCSKEVTFLGRGDCVLDKLMLSSYIRNVFVPEYNGSTLVSKAMAKSMAKNVDERRTFGGRDESWTFLASENSEVVTSSPIVTTSNATLMTVGRKRSLPERQRPILFDEEEEFDCEPVPTKLRLSSALTDLNGVSDIDSSFTTTSSSSSVRAPASTFQSLSVVTCDKTLCTSPLILKVEARSPMKVKLPVLGLSAVVVKPFDGARESVHDHKTAATITTTAAIETTTAASFNWAASASDDIEADLMFSAYSSSDEDSKEEFDKHVVDLTGPDSPVIRTSNSSPVCANRTQENERSPSRRGEGFDDSTLEFNVDDSSDEEDESLDDFFSIHHKVAPSTLISSQVAEHRYERLVSTIGRDLIFQLSRLSRSAQRIADGLSRVPAVTTMTSRSKNKVYNEDTKLYLTEAVMLINEVSCGLVSQQSRLLLCAGLKDQGFDPLCLEFASDNKALSQAVTVNFSPFDARAAEDSQDCSCPVGYRHCGVHVKRKI